MDKRIYYVESCGARLAVFRVTPEEPRFVVQIVHGIAEHKGRYRRLMEVIASFGGIAVAHDLRGHGHTAGRRSELGYFGDAYEMAARDIDAVADSVLYQPENGETVGEGCLMETDLPRFLIGHSMGSLVTSLYLAHTRRPLAGVILSGLPRHEPFVSFGLAATGLLSALLGDRYRSRLINNAAFSRYDKAFDGEEGEYLWLSCNEENRTAFQEDPLCGSTATLNGYHTLFRWVRDVYRPSSWDVHDKKVPLLLLAGENDPVVGGDRQLLYGERFFKDMGYQYVKCIVYRGMRHEIFNEDGREYVVRDVLNFIRAVLKLRGTGGLQTE